MTCVRHQAMHSPSNKPTSCDSLTFPVPEQHLNQDRQCLKADGWTDRSTNLVNHAKYSPLSTKVNRPLRAMTQSQETRRGDSFKTRRMETGSKLLEMSKGSISGPSPGARFDVAVHMGVWSVDKRHEQSCRNILCCEATVVCFSCTRSGIHLAGCVFFQFVCTDMF